MTSSAQGGPLAGVKIVDFGHYVAGPGAAMILADQGAAVTKIDRPGGPAMATPANAVLDRGKRHIVLDLKLAEQRATAQRLIDEADVVIENFRPGTLARLGLGPDQQAKRNPKLIYLSLPGFSGQDAEHAGIPAWEGIVAAAMGQFTDMGLNRVLMGIEASYSPLTLASSYAAVFGAMAVVLALRARTRTGIGEVIEVPLAAALMEALAYNSLWIEDLPERYRSLREREIERRRAAGLPMDLSYDQLQPLLDPFYRTYLCKDGRPIYLVSVSHVAHAKRALQVLGLWDEMVAAGLPQVDPYRPIATWPGGIDCTIRAHPITEPWASRLSRRMAEAFLTRDSTEWEQLLGEAGAPAAAHRTTREWLHSAHPRQAGLIVEVEDARYGRMLQPAPVAWLAHCPPVIGAKPATPEIPVPDKAVAAIEPNTPWLDGITILDMTNVIAGPTIAGTLARFGARVIKLDAVAPSFDPWNTVVMGLYSNRGKESVLVDINTEKGRAVLDTLIGEVDIVTINASSRQLAALGLDYATLQNKHPKLVLCQLDAWGGPKRGPRSDHPGYDDLVQAASGIMERFGGSLATVEEHAHFGTIDVLGGLCAALATSLALLRREKTGTGDLARTSLAAAGQWLQCRFLYDYADRPPFDEPRGRSAKGEGPLYRCYRAEDGWFFFAARGADLQKLAASALLGTVATLAPDQREGFLEKAFGSRPIVFWQDHLRPFDLGVQPLKSLSGLRADTPSTESTIRFRRDDRHPSGRVIEHIEPMAIRPRNAALVAPGPAEKFGASTRRILGDLGYSDEDVAAMLAESVVSEAWCAAYLPD